MVGMVGASDRGGVKLSCFMLGVRKEENRRSKKSGVVAGADPAVCSDGGDRPEHDLSGETRATDPTEHRGPGRARMLLEPGSVEECEPHRLLEII